MKARANTTVTVLRGQTVDSFGDPADTAKVVAKGVTASLIEQRKTVTTSVDGMTRQVRYTAGRVPAGTDIRVDDRVRDEKTNTVYVVDSFTETGNTVRRNDVRLDLRRVT